MKSQITFFTTFILCLVSACAQSDTKKTEVSAPASSEAPVFQSEGELPKGWPEPGPYDAVSRKEYPPYRVAFSESKGPGSGFWSLFEHIKENDIPMTVPVEMKLEENAEKKLKSTEMGFLYQSPEVGKTGAAGEKVTVKDMPSLSVLGYTWQGVNDDEALAKARSLLEAALVEKKLQSSSFRLFSYNGPSTPRLKCTHELQAILK